MAQLSSRLRQRARQLDAIAVELRSAKEPVVGAKYLIVFGRRGRGGQLGQPSDEGWFVTDSDGKRLSVLFPTKADAMRCRDVLVADDLRAAG